MSMKRGLALFILYLLFQQIICCAYRLAQFFKENIKMFEFVHFVSNKIAIDVI